MRVLTINAGSSSTKFALVEALTGLRLKDHALDRAGAGGKEALADFLSDVGPAQAPQAVAHRIVHGGDRFRNPVRINDDVLACLVDLTRLAPTHTPVALAYVDAAESLLPGVPQVAVFDTAFHASLPARACLYALPTKLCEELGIRRFGFHGLSHEHVALATSRFMRRPSRELTIISCHLGNGASLAAIEHGACTETSMGMTPLEGLVMGTRAGDLDPGAILALLQSGRYSIQTLETLLYAEAGLKGLTGTAHVQQIEMRAADGDESCRTALSIYGHRVRKYIGAYAATMGGVDVLAFTGGVGENSAAMRSRCAQRLDFLGAVLDEESNRHVHLSRKTPVVDISDATSRVRILVIAADEEAMMAHHAAGILN